MCAMFKRASMDVIVNFMEADPSFAGIGAYYSNVPMKVFMGNEPTVPVAVVAEALNRLQLGGASPQDKTTMKHKLQPDACMNTCLQNVQTGCDKLLAQSSGGAANMESAQCLMEGKSLCHFACVGVDGPATGRGAAKGAGNGRGKGNGM